MRRLPTTFSALLFALSCVLLFPPLAPASAASIVFDDDFTEQGAAGNFSQINFTTLANFSIANGSVDFYTNGGFGLPCPSNGCLDLDGTTGNAARLETAGFNLTSGLDYTLALNIAGNQRGGASDSLTFGLISAGGVLAQTTVTLPINAGFQSVTVAFSALGDVVGRIFIDHAGGDNFGILLDRVTLTSSDVTTVPLPAALPLLGFGLAGLSLMKRRRR